MFKRVFRRYFPLIFILWVVFVLYPNPLNLIISVQRVINFNTDPAAVESLLSDLPSDPADIEKAVLARIPYRHDWELYGMPWYCPTVEQVLEKGEGDCKARALVLASVLQAKNITYQVRSSPMPDGRKALLISGLSALIVARVILRRKKTVQVAAG